MAKRSIEDRLAQLDAQRQALKARFLKQERAKETRRMVLLGNFLLQRLSTDDDKFVPTLRDWLQRELPKALSRPEDQELFATFWADRPAPTSSPGADAHPPNASLSDAKTASAEFDQPHQTKPNDQLS